MRYPATGRTHQCVASLLWDGRGRRRCHACPEFIEGIVRELQNNPHLGLEPVGFLDDDLGKHDVKIHGVPVLGDSFDSAQDRHAIPAMAASYKVSQVIIAMPTAPGAEIRDILRICGEAGVQARTIPGIYELLDGIVSVKQVRDVRVER